MSRSTLACQLKETDKLAFATLYALTVPKSFSKSAKMQLAAPVSHSFSTMLAEAKYTSFREWQTPNTPTVQVYFNQKVNAESVAKHIYFKLADSSRIAAVAAPDDESANQQTSFFLKPASPLPSGVNLSLWIEPGLQSLEGSLLGIQNKSLLELKTYGTEPKFLGISCSDSIGEPKQFYYKNTKEIAIFCNPLSRVYLLFDAPVKVQSVAQSISIDPPLTSNSTTDNIWEGVESNESKNLWNSNESTYPISLPMRLKAHTQYKVKLNSISDVFGQSSTGEFTAFFATDHRRPGYKLPVPFPVIEQNAETDLPIYLTNIERFSLNYSTFTEAGSSSLLSKDYSPPKVEDLAFAYPLALRGLLSGKSGAVKGTISYSAQGQITPSQNRSPQNESEDEESESSDYEYDGYGSMGLKSGLLIAQVTPFHVHVKLGYFSSIAWVTRLADGSPVSNAKVEVITDKFGDFSSVSAPLAQAVTDNSGLAVLPGLTAIDPRLDIISRRYLYSLINNNSESSATDPESAGKYLTVKVQAGNELGMLPLIDNFEVNLWGDMTNYISNWISKREEHLKAWGTTAQGIYRPGDLVQYKILVRDSSNQGWIAPPSGKYSITIKDPLDSTVASANIEQLSPYGAFNGEFTLSQFAISGYYTATINFLPPNEPPIPLSAFSVLVSDFTPAPFKVSTEVKGERFKPGDELLVETKATLHSGGPYSKAPAKSTVSIEYVPLVAHDPELANFSFATPAELKDVHSDWMLNQEGALNESGELALRFQLGETPITYGRLNIQSAVRDDRGAFFAAGASANFRARDRYVGIRQKEWLLEVNKVSLIDLVVVDGNGEIVSGVPITVNIDKEEVTSAREQGPGNAFISRYNSEWKHHSKCSLTSGPEYVSCAFAPNAPGSYRFQASILDTAGRTHQIELESFAVGAGYQLFANEENTFLDVRAEKKSYAVGDKAKFFIKNPYPGAMALLTIERSGILKQWTKKLDSSTEIVEVTVEPDFTPGFFFGATVMSPRVEKPSDEQGIDLGKPAFKTGYATIEVNDHFKELHPTVTIEKEVYRPQEEVTVSLSTDISKLAGKSANNDSGIEYTVAVLDEAVFDLLAKGKDTFDPYKGFYSFNETLEVLNFNILKQLIGKVKFEKKGANPGGSGGLSDKLRLDTRYIAYWNPSLPTDAMGKSSFKFKLPDNLTSWRVLAIAVSSTDHMGLGTNTFKVNKETEIRSALPNNVRAGDSFDAAFSILNRTDSERNLEFTLRINGVKQETIMKIALKPYERTIVRSPVKTTNTGSMRFEADVRDDRDHDGIAVDIPVRPAKSVEKVLDYAHISDPQNNIEIAVPADIEPASASLAVTISPTIATAIVSAIEYLRDYSYGCWEQRISRAIGAGVYLKLKSHLPESLNWNDADNDIRSTLAQMTNFQAQSGGMAYYKPRDEFVSPFLSIYTAFALNWLKELGYTAPMEPTYKLNQYLSNLLKSDLATSGYMGAEGDLNGADILRILAVRSLSYSSLTSPDDARRLTPTISHLPIIAQSAFMNIVAKQNGALAKKTYAHILNQGYESNGQIVLNSFSNYPGFYYLSSPKRDACFLLNDLLSLEPAMRADLKVTNEHIGKFARAILNIKNPKRIWRNTQEAAVCSFATMLYATTMESAIFPLAVEIAMEKQNTASNDNSTANSSKATSPSLLPIGTVVLNKLTDAPTVQTKQADLVPGDLANLRFTRSAGDKYYATTSLSFVPQRETPIYSGLELYREMSVQKGDKWELLKADSKLKVGDLVKVDLFLIAPVDRSFVVVEDYLPGALEAVNKQLATSIKVPGIQDAVVDAQSFRSKFQDWEQAHLCADCRYGFYHNEIKHDQVRYYSEYLSAGHYQLSYLAQVVSSGHFAIPAASAHEMYDPDVQTRTEEAVIQVELPD